MLRVLSLRNHWLFFIAGTLALLAVGVLVDRSIRNAQEHSHWVDSTHEALEALKTLEAHLNNAESEQRAYLLLGDNAHLERHYQRVSSLDADLQRIRQLVHGQDQQERARQLQQLTGERRQRMSAVIATRQRDGAEAALQILITNQGSVLTEQIHQQLQQMETKERDLLAQRIQASSDSNALVRWVTPAGGSLAIMLLGVAVAMARRESGRRREAELALRQAHNELHQSLKRSESIAQRRQQLQQLGEMLQSCKDLQEAATVIECWMQRCGPAGGGALCLLNASENLIEAQASWGSFSGNNLRFGSEDCWAMRRGTPYAVTDVGSGLVCPHVRQHMGDTREDPCSLCLPLMAQGHTLGVLHLRGAVDLLADSEATTYLNDITGQLCLAVSNLRLQESLRTQSIRDPLTGLFNRRYLEASMQRELARTQRSGQETAVFLLDVDHFKRFNDTHGHDAGDALLSDLGILLQQFCRADDVACRYGGEEFVLLLPELGQAAALERAEQLLVQIRGIAVRLRKDRIGGVTASLGLALFPQHGRTGEQLLSAADQALYRAKHNGRDQVMLAGASASTLPTH